MNSEDSPSITDEPSMSSSIIEATVLNQEHNINQQHNVNSKFFDSTLANERVKCFLTFSLLIILDLCRHSSQDKNTQKSLVSISFIPFFR